MTCARCSELIAAHERHAKRCQASSEGLVAACHDLESQNQRLREENHKMFAQLHAAERWKLDSMRAWASIVYKLAPLARELGEDPGDGLDTCADAVVRGVERLRGSKP